ncbi:hypothetical protein THOB06_50157 [Vibrio rotiferianus]|nr:hypothetical protein THOG10_50157 [Vibrio rotiferianus]CAH1591631.1 hypothetical protein THOB06_50157 [Vibrio rotiferianus]
MGIWLTLFEKRKRITTQLDLIYQRTTYIVWNDPIRSLGHSMVLKSNT